MIEIDNIEGYLSSVDGTHYMYTGTFDPPHLGHLRVIEEASKLGDWNQPLLINLAIEIRTSIQLYQI